MNRRIKYPVGEQSFKSLREGGYLYVDKTRYIETLLFEGKYYFLGRPRRFGKSLFLSTLKCFFEGRRELFKGLYADSMDWDWEPYPVIHIDLNIGKYTSDGELDQVMDYIIGQHEEQYGLRSDRSFPHNLRLARLIQHIATSTGKQAVILVDEYDKPLVNNIHNRERFELYRDELAAIYSNFKSSADHIRLVFMTGVSRFGKLSVFSSLNNIRDISFADNFSGICGISEAELASDFKEGIDTLADSYGTTREQTLDELKRRYDGYHFARKSEDMYNPFSLLYVFASNTYGNYWIESGTPSLLLEQLKRTKADLKNVVTSRTSLSQLLGLDIDNIRLAPLFYQTGYLTIKGFDPKRDIYQLGIPNDEVREGFMSYILPAFANLHNEDTEVFVYELLTEMEEGRVDDFMARIQSMFAGVGYDMKMDEERNVQNALFILFRLIGLRTDAEYKTSAGRIDILVRTDEYVYVLELKYDRSAEEALEQIERKEYSLPWAVDDRTVIGVGINFSTEKRTVDRWVWKQLD
ncbi:MAG: ATP-binding protein [Bacteroides sp.]|nr:ATP-binding protein [Bacteroides sp.]